MEPFGEGGHQVSDFLCVIGVVTRLLEHPTLRISQVSILVLAPLATLPFVTLFVDLLEYAIDLRADTLKKY